MKKWTSVAIAFGVFLISFGAASLLPIVGILSGIQTIPGVAALLFVVWKLWREERAQERAQELQGRQQDFVLGTASHMAEVAYDKHVLFCEEYIDRLQQGFQELMQKGPTVEAMSIGVDLVRIRIKHSAWLTPEIERKLKPFEMAVIKIGSRHGLLKDLPVGEERSKVVTEVFRFFSLVIGEEKSTQEDEAGIAKDVIVEEIRNILGINILTELRMRAAKVALERVQKISITAERC